jgi:hypothetical protein
MNYSYSIIVSICRVTWRNQATCVDSSDRKPAACKTGTSVICFQSIATVACVVSERQIMLTLLRTLSINWGIFSLSWHIGSWLVVIRIDVLLHLFSICLLVATAGIKPWAFWILGEYVSLIFKTPWVISIQLSPLTVRSRRSSNI